MYNFSEKTVLITGASKGIGRAIALAYGLNGANVVATSRTEELISSLINEIKSNGGNGIYITGDLQKTADIKKIVRKSINTFGSIDVLVNNAAMIHPMIDTVNFDDDLWRSVINTNLSGTFFITKEILPTMIKQSSGKIINISSIGGRSGSKGRSAYRVTKVGLISLTETWAAELHEHGINVNAICPGGTDTEGYREAFNSSGIKENPKLIRPEEIAEVALFLGSDKSSAITGTAIDSFGKGNPLFN